MLSVSSLLKARATSSLQIRRGIVPQRKAGSLSSLSLVLLLQKACALLSGSGVHAQRHMHTQCRRLQTHQPQAKKLYAVFFWNTCSSQMEICPKALEGAQWKHTGAAELGLFYTVRGRVGQVFSLSKYQGGLNHREETWPGSDWKAQKFSHLLPLRFLQGTSVVFVQLFSIANEGSKQIGRCF